MKTRERLDRKTCFGLGATADLVALYGGILVGQQEDEFCAVTGDVAVIHLGQRYIDSIGDAGVEHMLGTVTQRDTLSHTLIL